MMEQSQPQEEGSESSGDAHCIRVRPLVATDAELLSAMHQRLSPESIYYRYLQPRRPTPAEIAAVCDLDPAIGVGFVAFTPSEAAIVGVAYYVRERQGTEPTAEPGILIEDRFQEQGIGRRLWQTLQHQAQCDGLRWLRVLYHPQNRRLARLVQGGGFPYVAKTSGGLSEYLVDLSQPLADQAGSWVHKVRRALCMEQWFSLEDLSSWN